MTRVPIQATKLRNRTAVTVANGQKNHLMRTGRWRRARRKSIVAPRGRHFSSSAATTSADARDQALHDRGREIEGRHLVAAPADGLGDVIVRDPALPVR